MNLFKKLTIFSLLLLFASPAFSATVSFVSEKESFVQNEEFLVTFFLDTEGKSLNAFEGKIVFSPEFLEGKEIRDGDSLINLWIERPNLEEQKQGEIFFSGITPGGFSGEKGFLFSIVFQAKKSGSNAIHIDNLRLLENDGIGTETPTSESVFVVSPPEEMTEPNLKVTPIKDEDVPLDFFPIISNNKDLFDGKYFLVFLTQDKGSGIDHYEVSEDGGITFSPAKSPYLLRNQSVDPQKIVVKAVDKNGNEKKAGVAKENLLKLNFSVVQNFLFFGLFFAAIIFFFFKKWRKKERKNEKK